MARQVREEALRVTAPSGVYLQVEAAARHALHGLQVTDEEPELRLALLGDGQAGRFTVAWRQVRCLACCNAWHAALHCT
jgi:hypothetical protein